MPTERRSRMSITAGVRREIEQIVDERVARAGASREDFSELKASVRELVEIQKQTNTKIGSLVDAQERMVARLGSLAEAQKLTEARLGSLAEAQKLTEAKLGSLAEAQKLTEAKLGSLAEAQKLTEAKLGSLAEAQKLTEAKLGSLAEAQKLTETAMQGLARAVTDVRQELGGLSRTMSYGLENEAYRSLPELLRTRFGIEVKDRFVRVELEGEEINLLAHGERSGDPVLIVGETKLRVGERPYRLDLAEEVFDQLDRKAAAASKAYPGVTVMKLLLTHFAPSGLQKDAEARGVLVVQSFEW